MGLGLPLFTLVRPDLRWVRQVVSEISSMKNKVLFKINGTEEKFDAIVFATGNRPAKKWLKGMPKDGFPEHWKGKKWLYCAGFSRRGLYGVSMDATAIANDINQVIIAVTQDVHDLQIHVACVNPEVVH
ncbi:putative indole-3-pyruvate monooxygenase YUCCA11 [Morella rubra]|uniref:indole-3-pyruvate monooxygenase n=1 Tax=Morella rubra TaxID=262757 RepID=A0A6A1WU03_9ROSI|nr:putative indole-3-pyruvate monooxygenase YUCCA11 [Morella rubra]